MAQTKLEQYVGSELDKISPILVVSNRLKKEAEAIEVTDGTSLTKAITLKKETVRHRNRTNEERLKITRQFDSITKQFISKEEEVLLPALEAESIVKSKILAYEEELEKKRQAEIKKIQLFVDSVKVNPKIKRSTATPEDIEKESVRLEKEIEDFNDYYLGNPDVNKQIVESRAFLEELKAYVVERDRQAAEKKRLDEEAAKQSAERAKIEAEKAEIEAKRVRVQQEEARVKRLKDVEEARQAAEKAAKKAKTVANRAPKTGSRTVMRFEIVNAELVPRDLCVPDESLVRKAIDAKRQIPGVKVWEERVNI